ncbi:cytochrome P450 [Xylariaceae sp. FL0255]|nr:cytochrome P450 [Xylariaceae sp. FL0255]
MPSVRDLQDGPVGRRNVVEDKNPLHGIPNGLTQRHNGLRPPTSTSRIQLLFAATFCPLRASRALSRSSVGDLSLFTVIIYKSLSPSVAGYYVALILYRLYLHPLARFPGPWLAAVSRWYEAYHDVLRNGQYTFKIAELHKIYGPIVRTSPHELHINDPSFFDQIYRQDGRWDKYAWSVDAFGAPGAILLTSDHELHKARRHLLNSFFSKVRVSNRIDMIKQHLDKLCGRITSFAEAGEAFNLGAAVTAFVRDVAFDFILGKNYQNLDKNDFDVHMVTASSGSGQMWRLTKHVRFIGPLMKSIPMDWLIKHVEGDMKLFFQFMMENLADTQRLIASAKSTPSTPGEIHNNIVHQIMASNLPASEKEFKRIFDDVATITGAGFETTTGAVRVALFHVFDNKEILHRLRTELATVDTRELKALEQLPYLKAVLLESLRISPAQGTRLSRIASDRDLYYKEWRIPAGTPVSMTQKTFAPFLRGTRSCLGLHLAWADMYLIVAALVNCFDFQYINVQAEDLECNSDQFAIGTKSKGVLNATASMRGR